MRTNIRDSVETIMQKNIPALDATEKISKISQIAGEQKFHYVPVMLNGRLLGIINPSDLHRMTQNPGTNVGTPAIHQTMRMYQLLREEPLVVSPEDSLEDVARIFSRERLSALPVVDKGKFVGIITANDILDYYVNQN